MALDPQKLLNDKGDQIAYGIAALSLIVFAVLTFSSGPKSMGVKKFGEELTTIDASLAGTEQPPAKFDDVRRFNTRTDSESVSGLAATVPAGADYDMPTIRLQIPAPPTDYTPPAWFASETETVLENERGHVLFRFVGTDHNEIDQYQIEYWLWKDEAPPGRGDQNVWLKPNVRYEDPNELDDEKKKEIAYTSIIKSRREGKDRDGVPNDPRKFFEVMIGNTPDTRLKDNQLYAFRVTPMRRNNRPIRFAGGDGVLFMLARPVGDVIKMPVPGPLRVVTATLAGVQLQLQLVQGSDAYLASIADPTKPQFPPLDRIYYRVLRWYDDNQNAAIVLPAFRPDLAANAAGRRVQGGWRESNPSITSVDFTDTDVQPERKISYAVELYHLSWLPRDAGTAPKLFEYVRQFQVEIAKLDGGLNPTQARDGVHESERVNVYGSALVKADRSVVLANEPLITVDGISPRSWPEDGRCVITITKYFPVRDSAATGLPEGEVKYLRLSAEQRVETNDQDSSRVVGGSMEPTHYNGQRIRDALPNWRPGSLDFSTPYMLVGLWDIRARSISVGGTTHNVDVSYVELLNVARYKRPAGAGVTLFASMDVDGNGSIDDVEFDGSDSVFAKLDGDKDGKLSEREFTIKVGDQKFPDSWPLKLYDQDMIDGGSEWLPANHDPTRVHGYTPMERKAIFDKMVADARTAGVKYADDRAWRIVWGARNGVRCITDDQIRLDPSLEDNFDQFTGVTLRYDVRRENDPGVKFELKGILFEFK